MSHSVAGEPPSAGRRAAPPPVDDFPAAEWDLLIRLPRLVIVAATEPVPGRPARGLFEGLAGLEGVAAGRAFDSELVRAVVAAIYTESGGGAHPRQPAGRLSRRQPDVLGACRKATRVLHRRADPADSAAYRQWVQSVAARVCRAAAVDDLAVRSAPLHPADRRFLDRLGGALGLR